MNTKEKSLFNIGNALIPYSKIQSFKDFARKEARKSIKDVVTIPVALSNGEYGDVTVRKGMYGWMPDETLYKRIRKTDQYIYSGKGQKAITFLFNTSMPDIKQELAPYQFQDTSAKEHELLLKLYLKELLKIIPKDDLKKYLSLEEKSSEEIRKILSNMGWTNIPEDLEEFSWAGWTSSGKVGYGGHKEGSTIIPNIPQKTFSGMRWSDDD